MFLRAFDDIENGLGMAGAGFFSVPHGNTSLAQIGITFAGAGSIFSSGDVQIGPPGLLFVAPRAQRADESDSAYQALVADGYLVSRQRSGIFVNEEMLETRVGHSGEGSLAAQAETEEWARRVKSLPARWREVHDQPNWRHYPYPFIDGKFDTTLFPLAEWREANRLALSVADVNDWATGSGDTDDPKPLRRPAVHFSS